MDYSKYCNTETQLHIMQLLDAGKGLHEVAKEAGVHKRTVQKVKKKVKALMSLHISDTTGVEVQSPYIIKGKSTLVDQDGNVKLEWIKTTLDTQMLEALVKESVNGLKDTIPAFDVVNKSAIYGDSNLLNLHVLTDYHLGMFTWSEIGGADWDSKKAEQFIITWFKHAIDAAPNAEYGVLAQMGDFFHSDSVDPVTPASKHLLDSDSKYQQMVRSGIAIMKSIIEMMRNKYPYVIVYNVAGNHDFSSTAWLKELFHLYYADAPDVFVDNSGSIYHAHQHGDVSLFFHHGHKRNIGNIQETMIAKFRDMFGKTNKSYCHIGHFHHQAVKESPTMVVEQHRTIVPKDAYAANGGYESGRSAYVITYHKTYGEVSRINIGAELIESMMS